MSISMVTNGMLWPKLSGRPLVVFNGEITILDNPLEVEVPTLLATVLDSNLLYELLEDSDVEVISEIDIDLTPEGD